MQFQKENNAGPVAIKAYKPGEIVFFNGIYSEPVLVSNNSVDLYLQAKEFEEVDYQHLLEALPDDIEVLLIGTGPAHKLMPANTMRELNKKGIAVEVMATRQACHTLQVLIHDNRIVVALLFP
ncbi:Mth938-like domain-containing protein [Aliikangiella sp. G2MR2-5]|uniref:Mth938-like domain-containing protein n=1 Tax=Aliikangiella sp. G2MR2-5 TaxID=2788943 RepID=UPI0018AA1545|nr:Mth938-like domain-containing protein [Aliikangiella sp. G2MR2-5]